MLKHHQIWYANTFKNNIRRFFWSCKQRAQKYCSNADNSEIFSSAH